jgi:hypothetical protein
MLGVVTNKNFMQYFLHLFGLFVLIIMLGGCKKTSTSGTDCFPGATTVRQITNKPAVIKLTATINAVYIVEQGSIDTKLIPCNFPQEFYQNDLQVTISGEVKSTPQVGQGPCCTENFVITSITR